METFDPAPAVRALRGSWPDARVAVEEVGLGFKVSAEFDAGELDGRIRVVDWDELMAGPATRVTFRSPSGTAADFVALAERVGLSGVNYAVGFTAWLDITAEGVSKASALERVRRRVGVPRARTVAVGDQRNDRAVSYTHLDVYKRQMPMRLLAGDVPLWQPVLSLLLTLGFAAATILLGETIYRRSILAGGGRVGWRQALRAQD